MNSDIEQAIKEQEEKLAKLREDRKRQQSAAHRLKQREKAYGRELRRIEDNLADTVRGHAINWRTLKVGEKMSRSLSLAIKAELDTAEALRDELEADFIEDKKRILGGEE